MANLLVNEKSPYLLQHAHNPVQWRPWNEPSLREAKDSGKPIFLSIGYSTCYWCHVMERESFENEEIAALMNDAFINIKVDREERPDLDRVYMNALQAMTGSGGWPMSLFLTPELKPFFAATYLPPKSKYGRPGFEDIIRQVRELWKTRRVEIIAGAEKITDRLRAKTDDRLSEDVDLQGDDLYRKAFEILVSDFDEENGGFGFGQKFPRPPALRFLLDYAYHFKEAGALRMVRSTLQKMTEGGIHDHIDGGFHRYAVDPEWRVPHFEKMLYDQAQLIRILADTYRMTKDGVFLKAAEETLAYSLRFLCGGEGAFYSAEDAESAPDASKPGRKIEGYFYLWEQDDIEAVLGKERAAVFNHRFGVRREGNTLNDPHGVFGRKNVLYKARDFADTASKFGLTAGETEQIIDESLAGLKKEREKRPRPFLDRKILTAWNGLMITALADAFGLTGEREYLRRAEKAAQFVLERMSDGRGKLFRRSIDGEVKYDGTLEDYAFFIQGLLSLYFAGFNLDHLEAAILISDRALADFYDKEAGGFFDSREGKADLVMRTKEIDDGAEPSGNAVMVENLLLLSVLTRRADYREAAEKSLEHFFDAVSRRPHASPYYLHALLAYAKSPAEIILTGKEENPARFEELLAVVNAAFLPSKIIVSVDERFIKTFEFIADIIQDMRMTRAYVCENFRCRLPAGDGKTLEKILNRY